MDIEIDDIASSFTTLFTNTFGRTLRFRSEGGSIKKGYASNFLLNLWMRLQYLVFLCIVRLTGKVVGAPKYPVSR